MSKVSIQGDQNGTGDFTIKAPNSNTDRTLTIPDSDGEFLFTDSNGDLSVDGDIKITANNARFNAGIDGSATNPTFIVNDGDTGLFRAGNNALGFTTGGSEAARIDSGGRINIGDVPSNSAGQVTPAEGQVLAITIGSTFGNIGITTNCGSFTNNYAHFRFINGNGIVGNITTTGSSTLYETSSDYRLKENVTDLSDGIIRLKNLPVYRFNFIADPDTTVDGFLAHEVQPYVPEAISGEKDEVEAVGDITDSDGEIIEKGVTEPAELKEGQTWTKTGEQPVYQGIDQAKLVPLLTAALQEAVEKIEQQQTQIDDLLTRVTALETQ